MVSQISASPRRDPQSGERTADVTRAERHGGEAPQQEFSYVHWVKLHIPVETSDSGPARTRTEDQGIHLAPPFPEGVDYLFTPVGCGTL